MLQFLITNLHEYCDAPRPWGLYFQDSAAPQMEGLVELHDNIMFYLIIILFGVGWILTSVIRNYASTRSPISHKYLNHGTMCLYMSLVERRKILLGSGRGSFNKSFMIVNMPNIYSRSFSTTTDLSEDLDKKPQTVNNVKAEKYYENADTNKNLILAENNNKSGIYRLTNKLNGKFYIGSSINLKQRFLNYFNFSYIDKRKNFIISRALIDYGYSNFSLEVLEYCDKSLLLEREQYYLNLLNPPYNILKIAGSSLGLPQMHAQQCMQGAEAWVGHKGALPNCSP